VFTLDFPIKDYPEKINLKDSVYLIGSCFSHEIGQKLIESKFNVLSNPLGTLYSPSSIAKVLTGDINLNRTIENKGVHYHWDAHGEIAALEQNQLKIELKDQLEKSKGFLESSKWTIITLGTAWVYYYLPSGEIVANCHKVQNEKFNKKLLPIGSIIDSLLKSIDHLKKLNANTNVIFTVSPVRHIKDGLIENNRSKARLLEAVHEVVARDQNFFYFPSYEICIDELRDYRFYAKDLVHPSSQAIDYIWERFSDLFFDDETKRFLNKWNKLSAALNHKPFLPRSDEHQKFLRSTLEKLEGLSQEVDLSGEIASVKAQLL